MRDRKLLNCSCAHCGGHIEFPAESIGTTRRCPHCGDETELTLPPVDTESPTAPRARIWAIGGLIVLFILFAAAFYALHRARQIRARMKPSAGHFAPIFTAANTNSGNLALRNERLWRLESEGRLSLFQSRHFLPHQTD
jgi:hypothetical protein